MARAGSAGAAYTVIPTIEPVSVNHLSFAVLAGGIILVAWSRWRALFVHALAAVSVAMIATWLSPLALAALVMFLAPPYVAAKLVWGQEDRATAWVVPIVVAWQVLLFIYLRRYEWAEFAGWLDHPVAVIGLSYTLFRVVHLVVEAPYLGHLALTPMRYTAYVIAFWTLISGPIQRYDSFIGGLATISRPSAEEGLAHAHRAVNGLIKAFLIAPIFLKGSDLAGLAAAGAGWVDFAIVFYSYPAYLYLNFSGYTDVVIAVSRLCGMTTMPENFNRPYLARNVQDFWTRWHMSFSTWIRHYVFTPLSKRLVAATVPGREGAMLAVAVVLTFAIVGAWHGTTMSFVVFGLLHGLAVIAAAFYGNILKRFLGNARRRAFENHRATRALSVVACFHFVCATLALINNGLGDISRALNLFFAGAA